MSQDVIRRVEAPWQFDPVLCGVDKRECPFLGHIDPHGVTVFSGYQLPAVIGELASLGEDLALRLGGRDFLDRFSRECLECARSRHLMWLVGD